MVNPNEQSIDNILEGEKINTDDTTEYQESTLEEAEEFAKKRNYTYEWNGVAPSVEKQYTIEKCPWDDWKATKDII